MIEVAKSDGNIIINFSKEEWLFIAGACNCADSESWPWAIESDEECEFAQSTYANIQVLAKRMQ